MKRYKLPFTNCQSTSAFPLPLILFFRSFYLSFSVFISVRLSLFISVHSSVDATTSADVASFFRFFFSSSSIEFSPVSPRVVCSFIFRVVLIEIYSVYYISNGKVSSSRNKSYTHVLSCLACDYTLFLFPTLFFPLLLWLLHLIQKNNTRQMQITTKPKKKHRYTQIM